MKTKPKQQRRAQTIHIDRLKELNDQLYLSKILAQAVLTRQQIIEQLDDGRLPLDEAPGLLEPLNETIRQTLKTLEYEYGFVS